MGSRQENWFYNQLSESANRGATWRVIGNQIIFSRIIESSSISGDNWNVGQILSNLLLTTIVGPSLPSLTSLLLTGVHR